MSHWPTWPSRRWLDTIHEELTTIRKGIQQMSSQMDELNAAITTLVADVQASVSAVQALIDKIQSGAVAADLTDEIAAVQNASSALEGSTASAEAAVNPPA